MQTNSLFNLAPADKLQLVEDLWDDIAADPADIPVYDWQKQELERRKAKLTNTPVDAASWDEMKARIRNRYGR